MCHTFSYLRNDYENCLKVAEKLYYKEPNNFTTANKVCHEIKNRNPEFAEEEINTH